MTEQSRLYKLYCTGKDSTQSLKTEFMNKKPLSKRKHEHSFLFVHQNYYLINTELIYFMERNNNVKQPTHEINYLLKQLIGSNIQIHRF